MHLSERYLDGDREALAEAGAPRLVPPGACDEFGFSFRVEFSCTGKAAPEVRLDLVPGRARRACQSRASAPFDFIAPCPLYVDVRGRLSIEAREELGCELGALIGRQLECLVQQCGNAGSHPLTIAR